MPFMAVAALAAGAVATGTVAAATLAYVGIAGAVVARVTKSKELAQISAGLSLGAGIAGMAEGLFGGVDAAAGSVSGATAAAEAAGEVSQLEALAGLDSAAGLGGATAGLGDVAASAGETSGLLGASDSIAQSGGLIEPAASSASGGGGLLGATTTPTSLVATPTSASGPLDASAIKAPWTGGAGVTPSDPFGMNTFGTGAITPPAGTDSFSVSKWWGGLSEPMKSKVLQMGGQFAGSLFDGWSAEQKLALERERMNLEKSKFDTSQKNASAQPIVKFQNYTAPTTGLLGARKG